MPHVTVAVADISLRFEDLRPGKEEREKRGGEILRCILQLLLVDISIHDRLILGSDDDDDDGGDDNDFVDNLQSDNNEKMNNRFRERVKQTGKQAGRQTGSERRGEGIGWQFNKTLVRKSAQDFLSTDRLSMVSIYRTSFYTHSFESNSY